MSYIHSKKMQLRLPPKNQINVFKTKYSSYARYAALKYHCPRNFIFTSQQVSSKITVT